MRTLILMILCLAATPVQAAMLLATLRWEPAQPVTLPAVYRFYITSGGGILPVTVTSYPYSDSVTGGELLAFANDSLCLPYRYPRIAMSVGDQYMADGTVAAGSLPFDLIWKPDSQDEMQALYGFTATAFVPSLEHTDQPNNLFGYWLTSIERTITAEAQTVRFYGIVIPEPATLIMLLVGVLHVSIACRRRPAPTRP